MALRGIQEYIARDVNNIARVEDEQQQIKWAGQSAILGTMNSYDIS